MDIKSVLDERIICTELDAVDKEDALKKMIKIMLKIVLKNVYWM